MLKTNSEELNFVKNDITVTQIARFPEVITMVKEEDKIDEISKELTPLI